LFLSPLISLLANATLAAVVVVTTLPLLGTTEFRAILRVRRTELLWSLASCADVVLLVTLQGILAAVAISVLTLTYQAKHPLVYAVRRKPGTEVFRPQSSDHPGDETVPGLLIVRTEGRMTFASAPRVCSSTLAKPCRPTKLKTKRREDHLDPRCRSSPGNGELGDSPTARDRAREREDQRWRKVCSRSSIKAWRGNSAMVLVTVYPQRERPQYFTVYFFASKQTEKAFLKSFICAAEA
jgi:hypothetical protein